MKRQSGIKRPNVEVNESGGIAVFFSPFSSTVKNADADVCIGIGLVLVYRRRLGGLFQASAREAHPAWSEDEQRRTSSILHPVYRLEVLRVETGVRDLSGVNNNADLLGKTRRVLVEDNVLVVLNEEALAPDTPERLEHVLLRLLVVGAEEVLEGLGSLHAVVVGDTRGGVVGNVRRADLVPEDALNPAHLTVDGGEGTASEGPGLGRVVGEDGVGVL